MFKYEETGAHAMFSPNVGEPQVVVFNREALANTHNVKLFSRGYMKAETNVFSC